MLQPPGPVDVLDRFAPLYGALHEFPAQLTQAQRARPTACAGWTAKDVAWRIFTRGLSVEATRSLASTDGNQELGRHALNALAMIA